jgi:hypothetical protein
MEESNDTINNAQLLIIIQGTAESSEVVKELASLQSLNGTTR